MSYKYLTITLVGACTIAALSAAAYADGSQVWGGLDAATRSTYGYVGGLTALNKDINRDGFLLRAGAGYGSYTYNRPGSVAGGVDGDVTAGDLMAGYQSFFTDASVVKDGRFTLYVGGDFQNNNLNKPDASNRASGSALGAKGLAELRLNFKNNLFASATGSYSGAFDTYWTNARVGYNCGHVVFGPEVSYLGNVAFDQQRYGAFISDIHLTDKISATVTGGYEHSVRQSSNGGYGDVSLAITF